MTSRGNEASSYLWDKRYALQIHSMDGGRPINRLIIVFTF
jgi:hypothetical protein